MQISEHKYALLYNFYQSLANSDVLRSLIRYYQMKKSNDKNLKYKILQFETNVGFFRILFLSSNV